MRSISALTLTLALAVLPAGAGAQGAQQASDVTRRAQTIVGDALRFAAAGDTAAALDRLDEAVRLAPGLAEAHYRRGLLLARTADNGMGDMFHRARAGNALQEAARLDPDDPRPYLEMGRLRLKQGFMRLDAHRLFNRAREVAERAGRPDVLADIEAEIGDIYMRRAANFRSRRIVNSGAIRFDDEAALADPHYARDFLTHQSSEIDNAGELESRIAEEHYRTGVAASPTNEPSNRGLLALLYDGERYEEYLEVSRRFTREARDSWQAHLFHALGLWRLARAREADRAFGRALELMPPGERGRLADLTVILRRPEAEAYARLSPAERQEFNRIYWSRSDPLRLTGENEHAIEHLARIAYTELRFAVRDLHLRGWETDRGVIYIRYGPPPVEASFPPETFRGGSGGASSMAIGKLTTVWYYPERNLRFVFQGAPGYNFARFAGEFHAYAEDARYQVPVKYDNVPVDEALDSVPVQTVAFRPLGDTTGTELVLFAGIPLTRLAADVDLDEGVLETGLFLTDRLERPVDERRTTETVRFDAERQIEQRTFVVHLQPGAYRYRVEARQPATHRAARGAADRVVESFTRGGFQLSDILMADRVAPQHDEPRSRADFFLDPNAAMRYAPDDVVGLYWEAYGLTPDSTGTVRLDVEVIFTIQSLERRGAAAQIIGGLLDAMGATTEGDDSHSQAYSIEEGMGDRDRLPLWLEIDLAGAPRGIYTIEIAMTDRLSGQTAVRTRTFQVTDERDP